MMIAVAALVLGVVAACWPAGDVSAQVVPDSAADRDLRIQGEYRGHRSGAMGVGLQVRGLGRGRFEARLYHGGLPGNGWYGGSIPEVLQGEAGTDDAVTVLRGAWHTVAIRDGLASLYDESHRWVANLVRVHRESPTLGAACPPEGTVLFDWRRPDLGQLENGALTKDGFLARGAQTRQRFGDFFLHVEFRTPWMPEARSQRRGNSGIYLQRRYEVQILDSFGEAPTFNGAASLYRTRPPAINAAFPPRVWQTYDIDFRAARFDAAGNKVIPAVVSVWHNGIPVHDRFPLPNKTGAGQPEGPEPGPILFQDHHDPVIYRLIWIVPRP